MASSPPPPTRSEDRPLDRLQRAVAGWVGPAVYALPILEVWLLSRTGEKGSTALLVVLQAFWVACFATVLVICARRWRAHGAAPASLAAVADTFSVGRQCVSASGLRPSPSAATSSHAVPEQPAPRRLTPSSASRRVAARPRPRRRGDH